MVTSWGRIAVTVGLGGDPADLGAFEQEVNPHTDAVDSNPVALLKRGRGYVVDAGGNDVVRVSKHGARLLALFQNQAVPTPD